MQRTSLFNKRNVVLKRHLLYKTFRKNINVQMEQRELCNLWQENCSWKSGFCRRKKSYVDPHCQAQISAKGVGGGGSQLLKSPFLGDYRKSLANLPMWREPKTGGDVRNLPGTRPVICGLRRQALWGLGRGLGSDYKPGSYEKLEQKMSS